jgi:hypothetical protein
MKIPYETLRNAIVNYDAARTNLGRFCPVHDAQPPNPDADCVCHVDVNRAAEADLAIRLLAKQLRNQPPENVL